VKVLARVPATSANLGAGFDCFGLALDLCNDATVDTDATPGVSWQGEGANELPTDGSDAISRAIRFLADEAGVPLPAFALAGENRIPLARGLGSSAAATVAGLALADALLGLSSSTTDLVGLAARLERHPDNVAAAVLGGFTIAYGEGVVRLEPADTLAPVVLVPREARLATSEARAILPETVTRADAVFNVARAAVAVVAFTADPSLLPEALKDVLHQPYRLPLVPESQELFSRLRSAGVPVCVSGAGPTLLAFETAERPVPDVGQGWLVLTPGVRRTGVETRILG
jgi:homoserine kinase